MWYALSVHPPLRVLLLDSLLRALGQADNGVGLARPKREDVDLTSERSESLVERRRRRPPGIADEFPVVELLGRRGAKPSQHPGSLKTGPNVAQLTSPLKMTRSDCFNSARSCGATAGRSEKAFG